MEQFRYEALNAEGAVFTGAVRAATEREAARMLEKRGLSVVRLEAGAGVGKARRAGRLRTADVIMALQELATMLTSGVPIVDAVGSIDRRDRTGDWEDVWFRCPAGLTRLMVPKGSIAVDGISLTLVTVESDRFSVMLIPHTQAVTTLGFKKPGDAVNLEADMLAKHVAKLLGK